ISTREYRVCPCSFDGYNDSAVIAVCVALAHGNLGWKAKSFDEKLFEIAFNDVEVSLSMETAASELMKAITTACDISMERQGRHKTRKPAYWWNDHIAALRARCNRARRICERSRQAENAIQLSPDSAEI
ncbi:uncharacterized protein LOC118753731, partial [Rhagoletis pomonella]|uniref:uncharacterized protein LOC118753731 n=1 Tax=Rhagoletis pomonella TaxID=28610 RepID=UPI00177C415B